MKRAALTFIGKDRPGIISEVSRLLYESGCNIEDTTMTILEEEFAMILIARLPDQAAERRLKKGYERLKTRWGLHHFWQVLPGKPVRPQKHPAGTKTHLLTVIGRDRTGIVYETSRILARHRLNITDLNSKILGKGPRTLFAMVLEVDVPQPFNVKRLDPELNRLKQLLKVDVRLRPLERLPL